MSEISVVVVGSTSINSSVGNGNTVNVSVGAESGGGGAAASVQVGTVTTVDYTQSASVVNVGTAYAAKLDFAIPRGTTGLAGPANSLSIAGVTTGATAAVSITGTAPSQKLSFVVPVAPPNVLSVGSVSTGASAAVSITGASPSQQISFVLPSGPQGPQGPANSLSVGSVTTGATAAVTITGSAPSQQVSFVLPQGPPGVAGGLATVQVGTVATGNPGTQAKVEAATSGSMVTLSFTIPRGYDGTSNLGDETPQPLGTPSAGSASTAARADHVHAVPTISYSSLTGVPSEFPPVGHQHALADVTGLQAALDGKQPSGTYATLVGGTVPSSQLPGFVDDVVEAASYAALPSAGESGKLYVTIDTRKVYRWAGSSLGYVEISASPGSTDSVPEGSTNLYFTNTRAAAAAPVQSVAGRTGTVTLAKADVGLPNVPNVDATLRANHTGTQTASTISDFAIEAAKYGPVASVAGLTGNVSLVAGANIAITASGSTVTIASTGIGSNDTVDGGVYGGRLLLSNTVSFTTQPSNQTAAFRSATFTSLATTSAGGLSLRYQWQRSDDGGTTWADIYGATSKTLTVSQLTYAADNGDKYRVVASALAAQSVASNAATLTIPAQGWQQLGASVPWSENSQLVINTHGIQQISLAGSSTGTVFAVAEPGVGDSLASAGNPGRVRVYSWNGTNWSNRGAELVGETWFSSGSLRGSSLGRSLALSRNGNYLAASVVQTEQGYVTTGSVRVYAWGGSAWVQQGSSFHSQIARALAISNDGTVVAASEFAGSQTVTYKWNGSSWSQQGTAPTLFAGYNGDLSLSADGNTLAVGELGSDDQGAMAVYAWSGSAWVSRGNVITSSMTRFGFSVALSADGSVVVVGAPLGPGEGRVTVYSVSAQGIAQKGAAIGDDSIGLNFGWRASVSDSGNKIAVVCRIGAHETNGIVRAYEWNGTSWSAFGGDIDAPSWVAEMSADGDVIVARDGSGLVRVYGFAG